MNAKFIEKRIENVRKTLSERDLDALLLIDTELSGWENVFYCSGFHGSSAVVLITHEDAILVTDSRYLEQAAQQSPLEIRPLGRGTSQTQCAKSFISEFGLKRCGIDSEMLSAATYLKLCDTPVEWVYFSDELARLRRRKDAHETELIRRASDIASVAYLETLELVRPGMTELEFSKLLELNIARHDGEGVWHKNSMIVASGERSAMPHGVAGTRKMRLGDIVTVDYGAIFGGYMSDITRNFSLGKPSDTEFERIHDVLLNAHRTSAAALRVGAKGCDVHAIAADIISEAGYGSNFGHALGHSFGLEIHEYPLLSPSYGGELEDGDVITIEPGIYIAGRGGLRLEDDYLITEKGAERLTSALPQEFVHLPL